MKKILFVITACILAAGAFAQDDTQAAEGKRKHPKSEARADRQAEHEARQAKHFDEMRTALDLTEVQAAQMKAIHEKYQAERRSIKQSQREQKDAMKAQLKALNERQKAEVDQLLTPEQRKKLAIYKDEQREQREQRRHERETVPVPGK
jgi:Spy/CpxP family protein refolding chaperone